MINLLRRVMFVFALVSALVASTATAQIQQENQPVPCPSVTFDCSLLTFASVSEEGSFRAIVVERVNDAGLSSVITTDAGINAFFEGMGTTNFSGVTDVTTHPDLDLDYLTGYNYRVLVGETMVFEGQTDTFMIFFVTDGYTSYIIMAVGSYEGFADYVEDVLTGDDWTITPEGYIYVSSDKNMI